jgi:hypothetical protein
LLGVPAAARVVEEREVVEAPAISTVRKGLAFPVPRPILLASLIDAVPNCAALMGFRPATLPSCLSQILFYPPSDVCAVDCEWMKLYSFALEFSSFAAAEVLAVYSGEMMRTETMTVIGHSKLFDG